MRVIVGVPGVGFRGDLRADDPVVKGGRTFVPVLTEQDFYRAETDQIEIFAPLVPIDRVWVEQTLSEPEQSETALPPMPLDGPRPREPQRARDAANLTGLRVVERVPDGFVRNLRAVTDIYLNARGVDVARVSSEVDWHRWAFSGTVPTTNEVLADVLWVE
jgi:hypothetical protein